MFEATSSSGTQTIELFAASSTFEESGPTGEEEFQLGTESDNWRACTIALRAVQSNIPTLSEWGLGIFAALFGIAAVWALRRRAVRA
ncbi:MAG: IPTL-CTERM sorting domain-containing protein [Thermodesulfobacteriota bacterium]